MVVGQLSSHLKKDLDLPIMVRSTLLTSIATSESIMTTAQPQTAANNLRRITLDVAGMTCASCASRVEKAINAIPGVQQTSVNLATDSVAVEASAQVQPDMIRQAIEKAGYEVPQDCLLYTSPSPRD